MEKTGVITFSKGMNLDRDISIFQQGNYLYAQNLRLSEGFNKMGSLANIQGNVSLGALPMSPVITKVEVGAGSSTGGWFFNFDGHKISFVVTSSMVAEGIVFDSFVQFLETNKATYELNYYVDGTDIYVYSNNNASYSAAPTSTCPYLTITNRVTSQYIKVIGQASIRNNIYLFCAYDTTSTPDYRFGFIYKLTYDSSYSNFNPSISIIYAGELELSTYYPIDVVGRYETETIRKLYWTDNYNILRYINVADSEAYRLLPSELEIVSDVLLSKPYMTSVINGGSYNAGKVQYAYQLYDLAGAETTFGPTSELIPLYQDDVEAANSQEIYGSEFEDNTGKAVKVKISDLDTSYKYLRVVAILYERLNQDPTITLVIDDIVPDTGTYEFVDGGEINLGSLTTSEFTAFGGLLFTAKTLASKDNYLLAGNITYKNFEVDFDARAYRFNNAREAKLNSADGTSIILYGANPLWTSVPEDHDCINIYNSYDYDYVGTNPLENHYKYQADGQTLGAEGPNIKIGFKLHQQFLNISDDCFMNYTDKRNEDLSIVTGLAIRNTSYSSYASPYTSAYLMGYQRNEVYRLGIKFRSTKGQSSFVSWICDLRMPHMGDLDSTTTFSLNGSNKRDFRTAWYYTTGGTIMNILYLYFTVDTSNLPSNVDSFEIVRVKREVEDRTIMGQGLVYAPPYTAQTGGLYKEHYPTPPNYWWKDGSTSDNLLAFISPEVTINHNLDFQTGDKMQVIGGYHYTPSSVADTRRDDTMTTDSDQWTLAMGIKQVEPETIQNWWDSVWKMSIGDAKYISPIESIITEIYAYSGSKISMGFATYSDKNDINPSSGTNGEVQFQNVATGTYCSKSGTKVLVTTNAVPWTSPSLLNKNNYWICNYFRKKVSQYGGNSYTARTRNQYMSVASKKVTFASQTVNVFGGDTFIGMFDYLHLNEWEHGGKPGLQANVLIPVETSINLALMSSMTFGKIYYPSTTDQNEMKYQLTETDLYEYNSVYSEQNRTQMFTPKQLNQNEEDHYDMRIHISELKTNGEEIDQWTKFLAANFYDVDTSFGPINKLILQNNYIYGFQERAFGIASINERALISDNSVPTGLAIGTGDVLKRFDYLSQTSGTKHQWSVVATNNGLYWYDIINNSIMSFVGKLESPTDTKGLRSYLFEIGQTTGLFTKDNPHQYCGVNAVWDPLFDEVNFSFKDYYPIGTINLSGLDPISYVCASSTFVTTLNYSVGDIIKIYTPDHQRLEFTLGYNGANYTLTTYQDYTITDATNWIAYRAYNTVSYNELFQCYQSFYGFNSEQYITHNGCMFSVERTTTDSDSIYIHKGGSYGEFYGVTQKSTLSVMMNDSYPYTKIFDNMVVLFNSFDGFINKHEDFFNRIRCYNDRQITGWKECLYKASMSTFPTTSQVLFVKREDKCSLLTPKNVAVAGEVNVFDTTNQDATRQFKDRMRDKYLVSEFVYDNEDNYKINVSLITYDYRISIR